MPKSPKSPAKETCHGSNDSSQLNPGFNTARTQQSVVDTIKNKIETEFNTINPYNEKNNESFDNIEEYQFAIEKVGSLRRIEDIGATYEIGNVIGNGSYG